MQNLPLKICHLTVDLSSFAEGFAGEAPFNYAYDALHKTMNAMQSQQGENSSKLALEFIIPNAVPRVELQTIAAALRKIMLDLPEIKISHISVIPTSFLGNSGVDNIWQPSPPDVLDSVSATDEISELLRVCTASLCYFCPEFISF